MSSIEIEIRKLKEETEGANGDPVKMALLAIQSRALLEKIKASENIVQKVEKKRIIKINNLNPIL